MTVMVEVEDLWYAYPDGGTGQSPWVLRGVTLQLARGELVCLLGPSGAGKSTLALALNGIVPQSTGGRIRGRVRVEGLDTKRTPVPALATRVGIVFQDPETQFLQTSVEDELAFGMENLGLLPERIRQRMSWALERVGLAGFEARLPRELSGGEKQRVALAAVLAMAPPVLVLDEPTASLDPQGKAQVFEAIQQLRAEHTVLVITQDCEWAADYADRVLLLNRDGELAADGDSATVLSDVALLARHGLRAPQVSELAHCLNQRAGETIYRFARLEQALQQLAGAPAR